MIKCKICGGETSKIIDPQIKVEYDHCKACGFIYKSPEFHVSFDEEEEQYSFHENTMESTGYVNIFKSLISDYIKDLKIERKILEFGSGPNPIFKILLEEAGYTVMDYDPFYHVNEAYKTHSYQLITSNEVPEHFTDPLKEIEHLLSLLEPKGYILFSTHFRKMDENEFLKWWYRRDLTHVSFYNVRTFEYIAEKYNLKIIKHDDKKVILFQKN